MNYRTQNHRIEVLRHKANRLRREASRYSTGSRRGSLVAEATRIEREAERLRRDVYGGQVDLPDERFIDAAAYFAVQNAARKTADAFGKGRK